MQMQIMINSTPSGIGNEIQVILFYTVVTWLAYVKQNSCYMKIEKYFLELSLVGFCKFT